MRLTFTHRWVLAASVAAVLLFWSNGPPNVQALALHGGDGDGGAVQGQSQSKADKQAKKKQQRQEGKRLAAEEQQVLVREQQQRLLQYNEHLDQQQRLGRQQSAQLQQQNRRAQYAQQQQYVERLRQQQARIDNQDRYNYSRDSYFTNAPTFQYSREGHFYQTNQAGIDLLQQAVRYGYQEGVRAGRADREDRWASGYQDSYAYRDANYGYTGFYVERDNYNAYFREGFRRGYEDSYDGRYQYGRYTNGKGSILGGVLSIILSFQSIR